MTRDSEKRVEKKSKDKADIIGAKARVSFSKNKINLVQSKVEQADDDNEADSACIAASIKKMSAGKKSGGFQSLGLSASVLRGVLRKGYRVPTPIQRKALPIIMEGRDVVAMARTGSGKTAAFLVPMFERLKLRKAVGGARALILSPTRELAVQTSKFTRELGRFTGLKTAVILGGDKIEEQFAAIHENPDILIATPGRLMHIVAEMNLKLDSVEYVVFDEADRLFEMGFHDQMSEILRRLRDSRQTLLFSATLPRMLVDFARAGLQDPVLIRLDVDSKLSDKLHLSVLRCRNDDKMAVVLHLLRCVVKSEERTLVFVATRHHVDYVVSVMKEAGIDAVYSYGALDPLARKINVAKFRTGSVKVMVVTDVAARGVDLPLLDNVINVHMAPAPKLFVHRVGRVARAGRAGRAFSLVAPDEEPYCIDLQMFLGRMFSLAGSDVAIEQAEFDWGWRDGVYGSVPQTVLDAGDEEMRLCHEKYDVESLRKVATNSYKQYSRTRPAPSGESVRRVKQMIYGANVGIHPMFLLTESAAGGLAGAHAAALSSKTSQNFVADELALQSTLEALKEFRPPTTIFEINSTNRDSSFAVMKAKRKADDGYICRKKMRLERHEKEVASCLALDDRVEGESAVRAEGLVKSNGVEDGLDEAVAQTFTTIVKPRYSEKREDDANKKRKKKSRSAATVVPLAADLEAEQISISNTANGAGAKSYFVPSVPNNYHTERGLSLGKTGGGGFTRDAMNAVLDLTGDDEATLRQRKNQLVWDRKSKKFVSAGSAQASGKKKRNEAGVRIDGGKTKKRGDLYAGWVERNKIGQNDDKDDDDDGYDDNRDQKNRGSRGRKFRDGGRGQGAGRSFSKKDSEDITSMQDRRGGIRTRGGGRGSSFVKQGRGGGRDNSFAGQGRGGGRDNSFSRQGRGGGRGGDRDNSFSRQGRGGDRDNSFSRQGRGGGRGGGRDNSFSRQGRGGDRDNSFSRQGRGGGRDNSFSRQGRGGGRGGDRNNSFSRQGRGGGRDNSFSRQRRGGGRGGGSVM